MIEWRKNFNDALAEAQRTNKFVLMDFFNPG